jgi:uncharacterized protein with von Willebrand factor type A (vWA) domain
MGYWDYNDYGYSGGKYAGGGYYTGGSWFKQSRKKSWDYWRPKFVQPDAACFVQDGWTQRQGDAACERDWGHVFADARDAGDFFSVAFEPHPEFAARTSRPLKREFCKLIMQHPSFAALRSQTRLDISESHVAAVTIAEAYQQFQQMEEEANKRRKKKKGEKGGDGEGDEPGDGEGLTDEEKKALEEAAGKALEQAQKDLADGRELGYAFGTKAGTGTGTPSQLDTQTFLDLYAQYKKNQSLQEIVKFAGRMRHIARSRQKGRVKYGMDSYGGVEAGDSIERLLPEEMLGLGYEALEYDTLQKIIEGEAMCLEPIGTNEAAYGPIILAVDESGSMSGTKFAQAMGIALTVAWIARAQRRWVGLYTFQQGPYTRKLTLDPNRVKPTDSESLMKWITTFEGGGTDAQVVTQVIPNDVDKGLLGRVRGKADLLVISDGCFDGGVNKARFEQFKKKHQVRVKGLLVGTKDLGALAYLADENHFSPSMDEKSSIAEAIFSL